MSMKDLLLKKHPVGQPASNESIPLGTPPAVHPVVLDHIDACLIRSTAIKVMGAAGPSMLTHGSDCALPSSHLPPFFASPSLVSQNAFALSLSILLASPL